MTPPPATRPPRGVRRSKTPRAPRRVSGPARPRTTPAAAMARGGTVAVPPPLGLRIARRAVRVGDARLLDRLVRGRAWIAIVAVGLLGIVFMQVSMLRLNAGISRAVTSAETLQRQNSVLRADISKLDSGQRIQDTAAGLGMVMPEAGDVHYLDGRRADGDAAAKGIRAPNEEQLGEGGAATAAQGAAATASAPAPAAVEAAPVAETTPAPTATTATQAAPATATTPAATTPAPVTTQPTQTAPAQTTPTQTTPTATAPAPAPVTPAGGATAPQGG
jgi:hypothetical protein